jgi:hypothetical protein
MKIFDRVKAAFDVLANGYDAARDTRYRTHMAFNRSPEGTEDTVIGAHDRKRLQMECRFMYRNNPIARGVVERLSEYAIFNGICPQPRTTDENWNKQAEMWWKQIFVPTCDVRQYQGVDLATFQKQIITERMRAGEMGFVLLSNGQIQPI